MSGTLFMGATAGLSSVVDVVLSLDTNAYATGDLLANVQELRDCMRKPRATGVLQSIAVIDRDDQGGALDLAVLNIGTSWGTENAALNVSDAISAKILHIESFAAVDYVDLVNSKAASRGNLGVVVKGDDNGSLWIAAISRDSKTYTAAGIELRLGFLLD
jgi:hypothetical protein